LIYASILGAWLATPIVVAALVGEEKSGPFGDTFGAINALFSGFAFAGVIVAILLQREELMLQREELSLTRAELRRTAEAQEQSGHTLGEQAQVMKVTAHLNGLSTLIQATAAQIEHIKSGPQDPRSVQAIAKLVAAREQQIEELELLMHAVRSAAET
jgi:hypothetical protein